MHGPWAQQLLRAGGCKACIQPRSPAHSRAEARLPAPAAPAAAAPPPPPAVSRVQARFNAFVRTFKEHGTDEEPKYMQLLQEVRRRGWD